MQSRKEKRVALSKMQTQRAFWISIGTGVAMLAILAFFLITDSGKTLAGWAEVRGLIAILALAGFISAWLTRRDKAIFGVSLILIALYIAAVSTALSIANAGIAIGTATLALTFGITFVVFPATRAANYANALALVVALGIVLLDVFQPFERVTSDMPEAALGMAGFLMLVYGVLILRRFSSYTLRTKLIIAFLAATIIPLAIVAFLNDRSSRQALTNDANTALLSAASTTASKLDTFMIQNLDFVRTEAQLPNIVTYLSLPADKRAGSQQEAHISELIATLTRQDPVYIDSIAVYDLQGNTLLDTFVGDIGANKSDRIWFQKPLETGLPYASDVEFSRVTGAPSIYFSSLVRDGSGKNIGLFRVRYRADILQDIVTSSSNLIGQNSFAVLIDAQSHVRLAHGTTPSIIFKSVVPLDAATVSDLQARYFLPPGSPEELSTNLPSFETALDNYNKTQPFFVAELRINDNTLEQGAIVTMQTQAWEVIYAQAQETFLAPIDAQARNSLILTIVIVLIVAGFAVFISQTLSRPLVHLTRTAETIAGGDIHAQAKVETGDEIGALAGAFNRMTQQLRDFIGTLEERVAERTQVVERRNLYLALASEVGQSVSQLRALEAMLKDAAEIIGAFFGLYYVQIYLANSDQTELVLHFGTGAVGTELVRRGHRLPLNNKSINGRAATEKRSIVIADTAASATFKPNPLLPDTRSEMAVPLLIGEKVVGVLDMQSSQIGALSEDALIAFEPMAGQLAVAIQNARLVAETERARAEVEALARRLTRTGWEDYLNAIQQPEQIGFTFANDRITPLVEADQPEPATGGDTLAAPIAVTGETLGTLAVEMHEQKRSAGAIELVNAVARQVSQQIENLRLLDSAERYRAEAEEAARRIIREGWENYAQANAGESLSYLYDLKEVRPVGSAGDQQTDQLAFSLPLKVRDETVGKLSVLGLQSDDKESLDFATAVAERLSTHIEGLRLSRQTEQALATTREFAQREQSLRQITSAVRGSTDPATILRTAARELGTLLGRKTIVRLATAREAPADQTDSAASSGNESAPPAGASNVTTQTP